MPTKTLVPRASGEGGIGANDNAWGHAYYDTGDFNKGLFVSGKNIEQVIADTITGGGLGGVWDSGAGGVIYYNGGNVGIGTTNPSVRLDVDGVGHFRTPDDGAIILSWAIGDSTSDNQPNIVLRTNEINNQDRIKLSSDGKSYFNSGNVGIGTTNPAQKLDVHGNIAVNGVTVHSSDDRVKHNEQTIVGALETLSKITPKKYIKTVEMYDANHDFELDADGNPIDSNGEPVEHRIEAGVIAQQVLTVDELAFAVSPEGVDEDGKVTSPHGLDYNSLFTYAIAAIQEQQQIIEDLRSEVEALKNK